MDYLFVSFRSREHSVKFSKFLNSHGIQNTIINTPKEAGVGCGLSVRVPTKAFATIKKAVRVLGYNSFAGYFMVTEYGSKRVVKSV